MGIRHDRRHPAADRRQLENERPEGLGWPNSRPCWRARRRWPRKADLLVCPPATLIAAFADKAQRHRRSRSGRRIAIPRPPAPIPAIFRPKCWRMPAPRAIIVGHSERRADHGESDALVRQKAEAAWRAGADRHRLHRRDPGAARCRPDAAISAAGSSRARCRTARPRPIWWWPMSRSGRSAPG